MPLKLPSVIFSAALLFLVSDAPALAQQRGLRVQLPTVRQFSVNTVVSVPDGGTMILSGGSASASGVRSRGFGPFNNRSRGYRTSRGQASVTAHVLSNREINEDILAGASPTRRAPMPFYKEVWLRQQQARLNAQK